MFRRQIAHNNIFKLSYHSLSFTKQVALHILKPFTHLLNLFGSEVFVARVRFVYIEEVTTIFINGAIIFIAVGWSGLAVHHVAEFLDRVRQTLRAEADCAFRIFEFGLRPLL